jgi:hypothetical protein
MDSTKSIIKLIYLMFDFQFKKVPFNIRFMKPFLTNSRPTLIDSFPKKLGKLARLLTTKEQLDVSQNGIKNSNKISNWLYFFLIFLES